VEHNALIAVVCPSGCPMPDPKLKMEGCSTLKIGSKEAHDTDDPDPFRGQWSRSRCDR